VSNAAFLLIVLAISVPVSFYLWLRSRKPTTFMSSIDEFKREMSALANDPSLEPERKRPPQPLRPIVTSAPTYGLGEKLRSAQRQRMTQQGRDQSRGRRKRDKRR
jgi:hypothetical protein